MAVLGFCLAEEVVSEERFDLGSERVENYCLHVVFLLLVALGDACQAFWIHIKIILFVDQPVLFKVFNGLKVST